MPLSILDKTPALIVIDLQEGLRNVPSVHPMAGVITNAVTLADAFRARSLPVVLVNATGRPPGRTEAGARAVAGTAGWSDLMSELGPREGDHTVTKQTAGAFHGTDLDSALRGRGVTQVFILGVATSMGVESTARAAHEHGYHVVVVIDASTDLSAEAHTNSVERVFPRLGERTTTSELLGFLEDSA